MMVTEIPMDIIKTLEQEEIARLSEGKTYPEFRAGDTVSVVVNVIEGTHKRTPVSYTHPTLPTNHPV